MRQFLYTMFISNNCTLFHLWGEENLVKHRKVPKYYETDLEQHTAWEGRDFEVIILGAIQKMIGLFPWGKLTPQDTM